MAIAVNGGHVSRALDFYNAKGKYFIIGGTQEWDTPNSPPTPSVADFKLVDIVGLKRVGQGDCFLVVEASDEAVGDTIISHRGKKWRRVIDSINTKVSKIVTVSSTVIEVDNVANFQVGDKIRVNNLYEGKITAISGLNLTLDTPSPASIPAGSTVVGGAIVEGAKYVYLRCTLGTDFPLATYRQIGLCTGVTPNTSEILKAAPYTANNQNEYESLGILEVLDNRIAVTRVSDQEEELSLIIEF